MSRSTLRPNAINSWLRTLCEQMQLRLCVFDTESAAAILTMSAHPLDYGTLPEALKLTAQYLRPEPNDVVLLNDPASGANHSFEITLITPIRVGMREALLGLRFETGELRFQAGPRVPPIPIVKNREVVGSLLEHLPAHWGIRDKLKNVWQMKQALEESFIDYDAKIWEEASAKHILRTMEEWPHKDTLFKTELSTGDRIELHLDRADRRIKMDLSGVSASEYGGWLDSMTLGLCLKSVEMVLGWSGSTPVWTNFLEIHTRPQTLLTQKSPGELMIAWAHPLALEMLLFMSRSLAEWTHRPWVESETGLAFLEWTAADAHCADVLSSVQMPWPRLDHDEPFCSMKQAHLTDSSLTPWVQRQWLQRKVTEQGICITRNYQVDRACNLKFWFSQGARNSLRVTTCAEQEETIKGQMSGSIELSAGEHVAVTIGR